MHALSSATQQLIIAYVSIFHTNFSNFQVEATFRRALAGVDVQNVILEISSLR